MLRKILVMCPVLEHKRIEPSAVPPPPRSQWQLHEHQCDSQRMWTVREAGGVVRPAQEGWFFCFFLFFSSSSSGKSGLEIVLFKQKSGFSPCPSPVKTREKQTVCVLST